MSREQMMRIHELLDQASIPIHGVSISSDGEIRIDFKAEATADERRDAWLIANPIGPRILKSRERIKQEIDSLPLLQKQSLLEAMLIEFIVDKLHVDPAAAERQGHPITGDEPND